MTPSAAERIATRAREVTFDASSGLAVGSLLSTLAATKPGGRLLELGTGVGLGTVHLLAGMSADARLVTVELDAVLSRIAQDEIDDARVEFVVADGGAWVQAEARGSRYDLVFADTWPGKFTHLDETLSLVAPGGLYVVDDLLPQPNWPAGHQASVDALVERLSELPGWRSVRLDGATGVMICARRT